MERRRVLNSQKGFTYLACSSSGILGSNDGITWEIVYTPNVGSPIYLQDIGSSVWEWKWKIWYTVSITEENNAYYICTNEDFSQFTTTNYEGIPRYLDEDVGAGIFIPSDGQYFLNLSISDGRIRSNTENEGDAIHTDWSNKLNFYGSLDPYSGHEYDRYYDELLDYATLNWVPTYYRNGSLIKYGNYTVDDNTGDVTIPFVYMGNTSEFFVAVDHFIVNPFNKRIIPHNHTGISRAIDWISAPRNFTNFIVLDQSGLLTPYSIRGSTSGQNVNIGPINFNRSLFCLNNNYNVVYVLHYDDNKVDEVDFSDYFNPSITQSWTINTNIPYTTNYPGDITTKSLHFSILNVEDVLFTVTNIGKKYSTIGLGATGPRHEDEDYITEIGNPVNSYVSVDGGHTWHDTGYPISHVIKLK